MTTRAIVVALFAAGAACKHGGGRDGGGGGSGTGSAARDAGAAALRDGGNSAAMLLPDDLIPNGLTAAEAETFFTMPEGSELYPTRWFNNLEQAGGDPFARNLARFGLIERTGAAGGAALPIGLTTDTPRGMPFEMIGVNCAACHVGQVEYGGKALRIVGAPNFFDIQRFYNELIKDTDDSLHSWRRLKKLLFGDDRGAVDVAAVDRLVTANPRLVANLKGSHLGHDHGDSHGDTAGSGGGGGGGGGSIDLDEIVRTGDADAAIELEMKAAVAEEEAAFAADKGAHPDLVTDLVTGKGDPSGPRPGVLPAAPGGVFRLESAQASWWSSTRAAIRLLIARIDFLRTVAHQLPGDTPPLYGRVDAFGFARNFLFGPKYAYTVNHAPVSYPHLWGMSAHAWLHWNGNTTSIVARNIGQALGVGAVVDTKFETSVKVGNLHTLEQLARKLTAPAWPAGFPIDRNPAVQARGKQVYERTCARCHDHPPPDGSSPEDVGTDHAYLDEFAAPLATAPTRVEFYATLQTFLDAVEDRYFSDHPGDVAHRAEWEGGRPNHWRAPMTYQARPLTGVWATAPYLHNNSVPSLAELLEPPARRAKQFVVGDRRYDPVRVGYQSAVPATRANTVVFDVALPASLTSNGNGNGGHDYGTALGDDDKHALLEYLKTL